MRQILAICNYNWSQYDQQKSKDALKAMAVSIPRSKWSYNSLLLGPFENTCTLLFSAKWH